MAPQPETLLEHLQRRCPRSMELIEYQAAHGTPVEADFAIRLIALLMTDGRRRVWSSPLPPDRETGP